MAEKKLEKGSPEWQFFMDFWKFRQKYHDSDGEPEDWYTELMNAGESIIKKYENTYFSGMAKCFEKTAWRRSCCLHNFNTSSDYSKCDCDSCLVHLNVTAKPACK